MKLRLHLGHQHAVAVQEFQNIAKVASQLFGGKSKDDVPEDVAVPQTEAEMLSAFDSVFGK